MRKVVLLITEIVCLAQNCLHFGGLGPSEAFTSTNFAKVNFFSKNASVSLSFWPEFFQTLSFFRLEFFRNVQKKPA